METGILKAAILTYLIEDGKRHGMPKRFFVDKWERQAQELAEILTQLN